MTSHKIQMAIDFNRVIEGMDLNWIPLMDTYLSDKTKTYIETGNMDLRILAILIKQTINEAGDNLHKIDEILWNKLHDQDSAIELISMIR